MCKIISSNELWDNMKNVFAPNNQRARGAISLDKQYGDVKINYFSTGNGITYSSFLANFDEDTILQGSSHSDMSFLCFNTGSSVCMEDQKYKEQIKFDSNICWSGKQNKEHKSQGLYCKDKQYRSQYITFDNNLFDNIMHQQPQTNETTPIFQNDAFLINFHTNISIKQTTLLNDLRNISMLTDKLQELYLESKVLDLIYTTINETPTNPNQNKNQIYLSTKDIECLQKAKNILIENMTNPPSLKELSRKSALNEFKLKKGFKQLFGNTVYGLLQEYRLNEAKKLLESNELNINEASTLVGYKSGSHFSKIFKEHFGINPIEIRHQQKSYYYN